MDPPPPRDPPSFHLTTQLLQRPQLPPGKFRHHGGLQAPLPGRTQRPVLPLVPVNYRKSIAKVKPRGGQGFRGGRGGGRGGFNRFPKNTEAVPFPQPHDGFYIKGVLVGAQVFLYDGVAYRFLRTHRGSFGQSNRQKRQENGSRPRQFGLAYDPESGIFPPSTHVQPVATLNLYEAYFLCHVAPCLEIWDGITRELLSPGVLMVTFTDLRPHFPYFFAAYCHFRMLNYVVMSGIKFGTDFVLYEYGPLKSHSIYMAYIVVPGIRDPSMGLVDTLQRIANAAKKDALLVRVAADHLSLDELNLPGCFAQMQITEIIVRRRERIYDQPVLNPQDPPPVPQNLRGLLSRSPAFPRPSLIQPYLRGASLPNWASPGFRGTPLRLSQDRPRRREGFTFPTVFLGVRRVFRGRSVARNPTVPPPVRAPVFRGLGLWSSRRGELQIRRPGFGIKWVQPAPSTHL
ncbi:hypothetical protein BV898_07943 [Hypsibius exemplaris]|uniref:tRNA-intron lyase n=1 Tax=Hypsibius exemplaris TaxID=2072580 RepID=A0A1W0WS24_HYPEX|nr:hypothetical protein BV898_07943 [Hypsibius exemplaris]